MTEVPDINFNCPYCGVSLGVAPDMVGAEVECPACNRLILVANRDSTARLALKVKLNVPDPGDDGVRRCPDCALEMGGEQAVCARCGHDFRSTHPLKAKAHLSHAKASSRKSHDEHHISSVIGRRIDGARLRDAHARQKLEHKAHKMAKRNIVIFVAVAIAVVAVAAWMVSLWLSG